MKTKAEIKALALNYQKIVEWSEAEQCYLGSCPELRIGGCRGQDRVVVYEKVCDLVEEALERMENDTPAGAAQGEGEESEKERETKAEEEKAEEEKAKKSLAAKPVRRPGFNHDMLQRNAAALRQQQQHWNQQTRGQAR